MLYGVECDDPNCGFCYGRSTTAEKPMAKDLFDYQPPAKPTAPVYGTDEHKLRRNEDPGTSHAAAESVDTTRLERMVHEAIAQRDGCIADDVLAAFPGFAYSSITARFSALERKQLISCGPDKRKGRSGRSQRVMRSIKAPEAI
jgi:hypothetical protein